MNDSFEDDEYLNKIGLKDERVSEWQKSFPWDDQITMVNKEIFGFDNFREN